MSQVGVKVTTDTGLWQYPEIIRNKMAVNTINDINIKAAEGGSIHIDKIADESGTVLTYEISTIIDSRKLDRPKWANDNNKWGKNLSAQSIFDDLFTNILPNVRGVYAGDTTSTDYDGNDMKPWKNELFGVSGQKSGLKQSAKYLRLYLTSQHEPIYICIGSHIEDITGGYNIADSDTVSFKVDDESQKLTAHVAIISKEQLKSIGVIDAIVDEDNTNNNDDNTPEEVN